MWHATITISFVSSSNLTALREFSSFDLHHKIFELEVLKFLCDDAIPVKISLSEYLFYGNCYMNTELEPNKSLCRESALHYDFRFEANSTYLDP